MSVEKRDLLFESPERLHRITDVIFAVSMVLWEPVLLLMPVGIIVVNIKNARDKNIELARLQKTESLP